VVPGRGLALSPRRPVERVLGVYLVITTAVAAARLPVRPGAAWVLASNVLLVVLLLLLPRAGASPAGRTLRQLTPLLILFALYGQIDLLNGSGAAPTHDALIQHWEQLLFGMQPSRDWWRASPGAFWSTLFHGAYLSFYPLVVFAPAAFVLRRDEVSLERCVLWGITTFLACYVVFILFPVAGPYYEFPRPTGSFVENPTARLVYAALSRGSAYGAAFPSSHVAAAVVLTGAAYAGSRRLGWAMVPPTLLMTVSVVYCQMHYAVDAIAGLAVGLGILLLGRSLARGTEFRDPSSES
jgi:membrane-associated phospholipid phosphatase